MNKQLKSPDTKPALKPVRTNFGLLWVVLCAGLLISSLVAGICGCERQQENENQAFQLKRQVDENQRLMERSNKLREDIRSVDSRLKVARDRAELLAFTGPPPENVQKAIAESMAKIDKGKAELAELILDLASSEQALEEGRNACLKQIRLLQNAGKISQGLAISDDPERVLKLKRKILEELEQMEPVVTVSHPSQAERQRMHLAIQEGKAKLKELLKLDEKLKGDTPEEAVQQFVFKLKQQIGDLRLSLSSDLAVYRKNFDEAVKSERIEPNANVKKLRDERAKLVADLELVDKQLLE